MVLVDVRCPTAVPIVPLRPKLLLLVLSAAVAVTVLAALLPTLRGGADPVAGLAHPRPSATPRLVDHVADSDLSPREAADAAALAPTAAGLRDEVQPLSPRAFRAPVAAYRRYAVRDARKMMTSVAALVGAVRRGDRTAAQAAWRTSYDQYLRLGAAYGALGDLDQAIDGLPHRTGDPGVTGLHRLERGLWTGERLASLRRPAARLRRDVARLPRTLARMSISPLDYATRAHEILEDAERDLMSGRAAPWSGAGLAATDASVRATQVVIGTLRGVLAGRGQALGPVQTALASLTRGIASVRRAHGGRLPRLDAMTRREHELVGARLGDALESLAQVPGALETSLPPAIPKLPRGATR